MLVACIFVFQLYFRKTLLILHTYIPCCIKIEIEFICGNVILSVFSSYLWFEFYVQGQIICNELS